MKRLSLLLAVIVVAQGAELAKGQSPIDSLLKLGEAMENQEQTKQRQFREKIPEKGVITVSENDFQEFMREGDLSFEDGYKITARAPDDAKRKIERWKALRASVRPDEEAEILRYLARQGVPSAGYLVPLEGYEAIALEQFFQGEADADNVSLNLLPLVVRGLEKFRLTILAPKRIRLNPSDEVDMTPANQQGIAELDAILLEEEIPALRKALAIEKDFNQRESDRNLPFEVRESAEKYVKYRAGEQSFDPADLENAVHAVDWFYRNRAKDFAKQQQEEERLAGVAAAKAKAKRTWLGEGSSRNQNVAVSSDLEKPSDGEAKDRIHLLVPLLIAGAAGASVLAGAGFVYWRRRTSKHLANRHHDLHPNVSWSAKERSAELPQRVRPDAVESPFV